MTKDDPQDWDLFISHASEDKTTLVAPLANALSEFGVRVWYDEFTLRIGDSLSRSIDKGLAKSGYGLVVLSPAFFTKKWPEYELRGLIAKEMLRDKVILPLWYRVDYADVLNFSPSLADKKALNTRDKSVIEVAIEIIETVRPDLFTMILRRIASMRSSENATYQDIPLDKIKIGPIQHEALPEELVSRIRLLRAALWEVDPHSMEFWLDGFRRDSHPSKEILFWERVATTYLESVFQIKASGISKKKQIFYLIQTLSLGMSKNIQLSHIDELSHSDLKIIADIYSSNRPIFDMKEPFDVSDLDGTSENGIWNLWDKESFPDIPEHLIRAVVQKEYGG